jgi:hypothetical protein
MDHKLLLVTGITLLYLESQLETRSDNSSNLVRRIVNEAKLPEASLGLDHSREVLQALKKTASWMCSQPADTEYEAEELLMRLKVDTRDETELYDSFVTGIGTERTQAKTKKLILNLRKQVHDYFREEDLAAVIKDVSSTFMFRRESITDLRQYVAEAIAKLDPFQIDHIIRDPAIVSEVDFSDIQSVEKVFESVKEMDNGLGVLKTGYQGVNRMLQGGFRRGEQWVIGALQHKYKTGFSLSIFETIALSNVPYMLDATKKPLLLRITFEDSAQQNMRFIYQHLFENETGQACTKEHMAGLTKEEISAFVMERMRATGYEIKIIHVDPTQWTYQHICNKVVELESEGFEIHVLALDYLAMVPTTGCRQGAQGQDLRDMFRRMRNFCHPRKITLITPHQLSTQAKELIRNGQTDFVKDIAEKGYWDSCKTIDNEVDGELYIHIEKMNRESFLTIQRGKHRGMPVLDEQDKYAVLKMHKVGALRPDLHGPDTTLRKVGGGPIGSGEETPFWDTFDAQMAVAH